MILGLSKIDYEYIKDIIATFPEIERAVVFGSRALGRNKKSSDVDIAIMGSKISFDTVSSLKAKLENESPMPYMFDIIDYNDLKNEKLRDHINRVGVEIYSK